MTLSAFTMEQNWSEPQGFATEDMQALRKLNVRTAVA